MVCSEATFSVDKCKELNKKKRFVFIYLYICRVALVGSLCGMLEAYLGSSEPIYMDVCKYGLEDKGIAVPCTSRVFHSCHSSFTVCSPLNLVPLIDTPAPTVLNTVVTEAGTYTACMCYGNIVILESSHRSR